MPDKLRRICTDLGATLAEKNIAYGSSFARSGEILAILYPNGVRADQMRDMQLLSRIVDKMFRVANKVDGKDRGGESPFLDIAGYAVCAMSLEEE